MICPVCQEDREFFITASCQRCYKREWRRRKNGGEPIKRHAPKAPATGFFDPVHLGLIVDAFGFEPQVDYRKSVIRAGDALVIGIAWERDGDDLIVKGIPKGCRGFVPQRIPVADLKSGKYKVTVPNPIGRVLVNLGEVA